VDLGLTAARDLVWKAQQQLPDTLRNVFQETIRPELIGLLRDCLPSSPRDDRIIIRDEVIAKLIEHHNLISLDLEEIKRQVTNPKITQQHIQTSLERGHDIIQPNGHPRLLDSTTRLVEVPKKSDDDKIIAVPVIDGGRKSLSEAYVFLSWIEIHTR
jgi:hypothetical protein